MGGIYIGYTRVWEAERLSSHRYSLLMRLRGSLFTVIPCYSLLKGSREPLFPLLFPVIKALRSLYSPLFPVIQGYKALGSLYSLLFPVIPVIRFSGVSILCYSLL